MKPVTVFIDGECPFCLESARRIRSLDHDHRLVFADLHDPEARAEIPPRLTGALSLKYMVALLPDGTWRTGYFVWAEILRQLPRTRFIGAAMLFPAFYGIGPRLYAWVAEHRLVISRLLRLPPPCGEDGTCRLDHRAAQAAVFDSGKS